MLLPNEKLPLGISAKRGGSESVLSCSGVAGKRELGPIRGAAPGAEPPFQLDTLPTSDTAKLGQAAQGLGVAGHPATLISTTSRSKVKSVAPLRIR